jgi:hypothetical protein
MRGCLKGSANFTCTPSSERENCQTLSNGDQRCGQCCTGNSCNALSLTGLTQNGAQSNTIVSVSLLIMLAVLSVGQMLI